MASIDHKTTRRALLGAAVAMPAAIAVATSALAEAKPDEDRAGDRYRLGFESGSEIAMLHMARAWVDRWKAAGGNFCASWNSDGSVRGLLRGMTEPHVWTPTDEGKAHLEPHQWLTDREHQRGAIIVLEALLTLVPGLKDAVAGLVGSQLLTTHLQEA